MADDSSMERRLRAGMEAWGRRRGGPDRCAPIERTAGELVRAVGRVLLPVGYLDPAGTADRGRCAWRARLELAAGDGPYTLRARLRAEGVAVLELTAPARGSGRRPRRLVELRPIAPS